MIKITRYTLLISFVLIVLTLSLSMTFKKDDGQKTSTQIDACLSEQIKSRYNLSQKNIFDLRFQSKHDSLLNSNLKQKIEGNSILKFQMNLRGIIRVLNDEEKKFIHSSNYLGYLAPVYLINKPVYLKSKSSRLKIFSEQLAIRFFGEALASYNGFCTHEFFEIKQNEALSEYGRSNGVRYEINLDELNKQLHSKYNPTLEKFLSFIIYYCFILSLICLSASWIYKKVTHKKV